MIAKPFYCPESTKSDCQECDPIYETVCEEIGDPDATGGTGYVCTEELVDFWCYDVPCEGGEDSYPDDDCNNPNNYDLPDCCISL